VNGDLATLVAGGSAAIAFASLLWAIRVTDGARGALTSFRERTRQLEDKVSRADSIFGAHPGVVLIWEEAASPTGEHDWGSPRIYGAPLALASLLRFSDANAGAEPAVRILKGLSAFDARDATGATTRLATALTKLRRDGAAFSLTISTSAGVFVEIDGRTAGARAVVWILDTGVRGVEEGGAAGRIEEARQVIARDPAAFLEMLAAAPFLAWRISTAGKLEWANGEYLAALEAKSLDQAIARNLQFDQAAIEQARRAMETGEPVEETRPAVIKGERRIIRIAFSPVAGGAAGVAIDVTEAEAAREALAKQARSHDETLNHLAEGVAVFGADKRLIFHNRAFEQMWELEPSFLAERPTHAGWLDHLKNKRRLPAHANYAEWRAGELALYLEVGDLPEALWVLPDGRTLRVARQRHPGGGLLLVFDDMTNELSLRSRYDALVQTQKAALDKLHEGVVVFGLDGRLKLSNAAFANIWRIPPEALEEPNLAFDDFVELCRPLFHEQPVWTQVRARITDPSPEARTEFRGEMRRSDETILRFLTRPLPDGATLVAFQDVTAARRVEEALRDRAEAFEAADKLKTQFVENVSRQLRDPLQAIQGYAEMLSQRLFGPLNDRQAEHVDCIVEAANDLGGLVHNILDVAMVEAGSVQLDLRPMDIRKALEDSAQMAASKARDTEVPIKIVCEREIGAVMADENRIKQVLVHLLSNALRHTERGDSIVAGAERQGGVLQLYVEDTGDGMAPDAQARAFDSFESGDNSGAGLGLALVRSFVEMHGGWVAMSSEPGQGARVTCHLPAIAPAVGAPPAPKSGVRAA
jgi:signal transduction histidine kinase